MADWGIQTWDANGVPNNYGLVPIYILGQSFIGENQEGSWSYNVPNGFSLDYLMVPNPGGRSPNGRRIITISGSTIIASNTDSNNASPNTFPRSAYSIVAFIRSN